MNKRERVTVLIYVHNDKDYIDSCLQRLRVEDRCFMEIIAIDDGSRDGSIETLKGWRERWKDIKLYMREGEGVIAARNFGIERARGKYIHFLDVRDVVEIGFYQNCIATMEAKDLDILTCKWLKISGKDIKEDVGEEKKLDIFSPSCRYYSQIDFEDVERGIFNKIYRVDFLREKKLYFVNERDIVNYPIFSILCGMSNPKEGSYSIPFYLRRETPLSNNDKGKEYFKDIKSILERKREGSEGLEIILDRHIWEDTLYFLNAFPSLVKDRLILGVIRRIISVMRKYYPGMSRRQIFSWVTGGIPVVIATDNGYALPTVTCMYSILKHTKRFIHFFILSPDITEENLERIRISLKKFKNTIISLIGLEDIHHKTDQFPYIHPYKKTTYARYFIPEYCSFYKKVVYTDPDVIFMKDIKDYYNTNLEKYGLAASPEEIGIPYNIPYNHQYRKKLFKMDICHSYFSAGNLIINCDYWRDKNIVKMLEKITFIWKNNLVCPDLDALNIVFQNNYRIMDYRYCCCVHAFDRCGNNQEMIDAFNDPFIIHYSGINNKPWKDDSVLFYKEWFDCYKKIERYLSE